MKILVIPDVHGSHHWTKAKDLINEVDKVIFMGDYVDSWENKWPDQGENLYSIFKFAREHEDKVDVLIGNHDWSYISESRYGYQVSGHQGEKAGEIQAILKNGEDLLKAVVCYDNWVFSHAGLTKDWLNIFEYYYDLKEIKCDTANLFDKINYVVHNHKMDDFFDWRGTWSGSGDETIQGPFWVRPNSLLSNALFPQQIVGHTEVVEGVDFFAKKDDNKVIVVDSPEHDNLLVFDTEKEYEFLTLLELARKEKKRQKEINNARSREGQAVSLH